MLKSYKSLVLFVLWLFTVTCAYAQIPLSDLYGTRDASILKQLIADETPAAQSPEQLKRIGIAWHNLAVLEESGASEQAYNILKPLHKTLPKDNEVLVYLGSAQTMVARDSWNVITKTIDVNKGIGLLDKAVDADKNNLIVRIVRANNSLTLPAFLMRKNKGKEDLEFMVDQFNSPASFRELPALAVANLQGETYYRLGLIAAKEDQKQQSKTYFKKVMEVAAQTEWAKRAQGELHD